jgi:YidC/Oxa1 family membrane protein insertase
MIVSQKTNKMNANDTGTNSSMKSMMIIQPLISLWIGFTLPAGLCVYWIANSVLMMVQEWLCGKMLRKDYEAARVAMEEQKRKEKELEKERRREAAERKAAAIAANKGKKKTQAPAKEKIDNSASREGLRSNARGRSYDPNRYPTFAYVDPNEKNKKPVAEEETLTEEEKEILVEAGVEIPEEIVVEAEPTAEVEVETEGEYEEAYAAESEEETKEV